MVSQSDVTRAIVTLTALAVAAAMLRRLVGRNEPPMTTDERRAYLERFDAEVHSRTDMEIVDSILRAMAGVRNYTGRRSVAS